MLKSGNDAALLLAQTLGGSTEHFVELMNAKAAELGMTHTNFINPSGAYKRDQFSTARDMAIL
jgi:D-alanyl-D-alanine carboxypeptidase